MIKKLTRRTVLGGLAALPLVGKARAEPDWPTRTITIIHGFPAGGPSDVIARIIADGLSRSLGQAVIVEPRPGASGTAAAAKGARTAPDGQALNALPLAPPRAAAFTYLPYRSVHDFTTITLASEYPYVLATNVDSGIKSVAELIGTAHKRPNPLLYGTPGVGSGPHLAIELFAIETKIKVLHVPYRGSAPAVMELVGGRLDFMMDPPATMMEFIRNGRLRALAGASAKEYCALPAAPAIAERGVPDFDVSAWQGLVAPAGLPEPILNRLNAEVVRILKDPATVERMHTFGNEPAPTTPAEFKKRLIDDIAKWTAVAEQIHFEKI